ncbi:MAG: DUF938 domain-containing protein [Methylococcaceae bacterium]
MMNKPFSQACENNKAPILQVIREVFTRPVTVWEIGSGTGQHGCYFAEQMPHLEWQPTDRQENITGIRLWREDALLSNLKPPLVLDVTNPVWPCNAIDAVFTANTLHIMSWEDVKLFFTKLGRYLNADAQLCIYGPFNYNNAYTSGSNARFDQLLKERDPLSGVRDFEAVMLLAAPIGLVLLADVGMPANNRLLILQKKAAG